MREQFSEHLMTLSVSRDFGKKFWQNITYTHTTFTDIVSITAHTLIQSHRLTWSDHTYSEDQYTELDHTHFQRSRFT